MSKVMSMIKIRTHSIRIVQREWAASLWHMITICTLLCRLPRICKVFHGRMWMKRSHCEISMGKKKKINCHSNI